MRACVCVRVCVCACVHRVLYDQTVTKYVCVCARARARVREERGVVYIRSPRRGPVQLSQLHGIFPQPRRRLPRRPAGAHSLFTRHAFAQLEA